MKDVQNSELVVFLICPRLGDKEVSDLGIKKKMEMTFPQGKNGFL